MTLADLRALIAERAAKTAPLIAELGTVLRDDAKPLDHRQRRERELRASIDSINTLYNRRIAQTAHAAAQEPQRRRANGTPLKADQLAEAQLFTDQYRGRTRQEQRQLVSDIAADLEAGATDRALAKARAARTLNIPLGSLQRPLADADPVHRAARDELDAIEGMAELALAEPIRELAAAGFATASERAALKAFAADRSLRPDAPFAAQVEPGYAGPTVADAGFPNAPFPEPHDAERDRQRQRVEHLAGNEPASASDAEARYAARRRR